MESHDNRNCNGNNTDSSLNKKQTKNQFVVVFSTSTMTTDWFSVLRFLNPYQLYIFKVARGPDPGIRQRGHEVLLVGILYKAANTSCCTWGFRNLSQISWQGPVHSLFQTLSPKSRPDFYFPPYLHDSKRNLLGRGLMDGISFQRGQQVSTSIGPRPLLNISGIPIKATTFFYLLRRFRPSPLLLNQLLAT